MVNVKEIQIGTVHYPVEDETKVAISQGTFASGKYLGVNASGNVEPMTIQSATQATGTLTSSGWSSSSQTISVTGVTASNIAIVSPSPSSFNDYCNAKIYCTSQDTGTLTFTCTTTPTADITVNVVIL